MEGASNDRTSSRKKGCCVSFDKWMCDDYISVSLMINLYRPSDNRNKNKSLFPVNKSHTASMNLKIAPDVPLESTHRENLKHSYRQN